MKIVCTKLEFAALIRGCEYQKERTGCEECLLYGFCNGDARLENDVEFDVKEEY